LYKRVARIDIL